MNLYFPVLQLRRLRFHCQSLDALRLPYFSGSAWRGLLGHSLRRSVCVTRAPHCDGCLLRGQCVYSRFFETPPLSPEMSLRYNALPHPFVLEPPPAGARDHAPGDPLSLGITLIGPRQDIPAYLIHAMQRAGERGLGRTDGRFQLLEVTQERTPGSGDWQCIFNAANGQLIPLETSPPPAPPPRPEPLEFELLTPLRIKRGGQYVSQHQLDSRALLGSLIARIALLQELYPDPSEGTKLSLPDMDHLKQAVDQVRIEHHELEWVDWTRWSSRQATHMQLGGLLGSLRLTGQGLDQLWPLIVLGQWVHLGKQSSFGLGCYRVKTASVSEETG
ncbi:Uncharacterized conserved protein (DUF2276) [Thiorhodovibrio frisius]|uniref:Uncharacterized conserved protein (DUF2276) n=1 Tax=Thiorhodovibrio frisius TaxID=631362 RepID=H8Z1Z8_9GAMM|nr:Uncharacterized conserved protein (DUF2276) [Thiorhodovibrio frisius]WPL24107.1 hypothetical protein Thiofri_04319 [Thiorhodovibrio frisius]